jgi:hypothetical protein
VQNDRLRGPAGRPSGAQSIFQFVPRRLACNQAGWRRPPARVLRNEPRIYYERRRRERNQSVGRAARRSRCSTQPAAVALLGRRLLALCCRRPRRALSGRLNSRVNRPSSSLLGPGRADSTPFVRGGRRKTINSIANLSAGRRARSHTHAAAVRAAAAAAARIGVAYLRARRALLEADEQLTPVCGEWRRRLWPAKDSAAAIRHEHKHRHTHEREIRTANLAGGSHCCKSACLRAPAPPAVHCLPSGANEPTKRALPFSRAGPRTASNYLQLPVGGRGYEIT